MSRKYMNDKWRVRCGKKDPTPFLREMFNKYTDKFLSSTTVVDIGCGNGRNTMYMDKQSYYDIDSLDMCNDFGIKFNLGHDKFPRKSYDIFLVNYILMFLNTKERLQVMNEIHRTSKKLGSMLLIEMYPAKDAYKYNFNKMINFFLDKGWIIIVKRKDKCMLWR